MNLVIDTNIFISALIKDGMTRDLIINSPFNLLIPEQEIVEVKKHEKLISRKSGKTLDEVRDLIRRLLKYVTIVRNNLLLDYRGDAKEIIGKIDEGDIPFIAAALYLNCPVWSDDSHFREQKEVKILTTKDILGMGTK